MAIDFPDVARCAMSGTYNGRPWVNVVHIQKRDLSAITVANAATIAGLLDGVSGVATSWASILTRMDSGLSMDLVHVRTLAETAPVEASATTSRAGGSGGTDAPPLLAVMVKWATSIATGQARGRQYFAGVNTGMFQADSDRMDPTFQANVQTSVDAFIAAWAANATYAFVVFSRKGAETLSGPTVTEIKSASVDPLFRIQRRRRG